MRSSVFGGSGEGHRSRLLPLHSRACPVSEASGECLKVFQKARHSRLSKASILALDVVEPSASSITGHARWKSCTHADRVKRAEAHDPPRVASRRSFVRVSVVVSVWHQSRVPQCRVPQSYTPLMKSRQICTSSRSYARSALTTSPMHTIPSITDPVRPSFEAGTMHGMCRMRRSVMISICTKNTTSVALPIR